MVKVKNKGNPIYIGPTLCPRNQITPVKEKALEAYLQTPGGSALYNKSLFVFDDDFEKQQKAERNAAKSQAIAEARKALVPEITKEVEDRLKALYEKKILGLNDKIVSLNAELDSLKQGTSDPAPPEKASGDDTAEKVEPADNDFVFDPEKHSVEHRGGGNWYVMDGETKVSKSLSAEEKEKYEALIKGE